MQALVPTPRPYLDLLQEMVRDALKLRQTFSRSNVAVGERDDGDRVGSDVREEGGDERPSGLRDGLEYQSLGHQRFEEGRGRHDAYRPPQPRRGPS